ncbi:hypothetical protein ACYOEI_38790 [Singulisphaera rosea]
MAAEVATYGRRFITVPPAPGLIGLEMMRLFPTRFRQEDRSRETWSLASGGRNALRGPRHRSGGQLSPKG